MASIRNRLTLGFAGAMVATMAMLAIALMAARRSTALRELDERVGAEADQAMAIVERVRLTSSEKVVVTADSLFGRRVSANLASLLDVLPDYVIAKDSAGVALYVSPLVRDLGPDDRARLDSITTALRSSPEPRLVRLSSTPLLLVSRDARATRTAIHVLWVGVSTAPAALAPWEYVGTILVTFPFLLAFAVGIAYLVAGRAFRPIDRLIDQVEAITDGRSLHRRLAVEAAGDELTRLSGTVNAMIGRLENSFAALRRFTADASHELKTPLAVLRADVERAMAPRTPQERAVALEEALQQVTRMADLVDSLLTLARFDEGRFDLHRERVPLGPLFSEVADTARLLAEDTGLTIIATAPPIAPDVMGDPTRLRQLFLNVVTNGIKYTPKGGTVELTLGVDEGMVLFSVRDTGIGIAAADLPHLFERFWRADRVRSRGSERGGFGLGLAICQWIAQAHGGTITVASRLGRGSTFTITLPVADTTGDDAVDEAVVPSTHPLVNSRPRSPADAVGTP
ncbi:MAG: HAMP domain-containing histidine kinase [Gemmatimonadaceae bacterium]|jgi:signal transduction histidine kinase|nr:HAMP domain-containing histidine kinase [Gemmatimonadaceae bacterium]